MHFVDLILLPQCFGKIFVKIKRQVTFAVTHKDETLQVNRKELEIKWHQFEILVVYHLHTYEESEKC